MKILVAPDSFKGSLTAADAARAMARGARRAWPGANIVEMPIADGGEGTTDALVAATGGRRETRRVTGPLGMPVIAHLGLLGPDYRTAVVEMAQAAGLGLVAPTERDPRVTTTYGVGELLRAAADLGAARIIIGLGGSATNDGGAGAMAALGARFLDADDRPLPFGGAALARLARIDLARFRFPLDRVSVTVASDVQNPLVGPDGASAVYGPQKGADAATVAELDAALHHYAHLLNRDVGRDVAEWPGSGAAGGLGAALAAFLNAEFQPGIDVVLDAAGFEAQARDADWALTGEGKVDSQTLHGKAIAGLLRRCRRVGVPLIAFGGVVEDGIRERLHEQGLTYLFPVVREGVTAEQSLREPQRALEEAVAEGLSRVLL